VLSSPDPAVSLDPAVASALDRAIDDRAEDAFAFLERLVAAPSTVGARCRRSRWSATSWTGWASAPSVQPIPEDIAADPGRGRTSAGVRGPGQRDRAPRRGDRAVAAAQRAHRRGAGRGAAVVRAAVPAGPPGRLAGRPRRGRHEGRVRAGHAGPGGAAGRRAWLAARPAQLRVGHRGGVAPAMGHSPRPARGCWPTRPCSSSRPTWGCCWAAWGSSGPRSPCAGSPRTPSPRTGPSNPVDSAWRVIDAIRSLEKEMASQLGGPFARVGGACAVNVGTFHAGDWPSSVPGQAVLGVRVGSRPGGRRTRR